MRTLFTLLSLLFLTNVALSQTVQQNSGWLFLMNTTKLSEKWATHLDVQFRSADNWDYLRNFMFRPGITHIIDSKNELTLGYLLNDTFSRLDGSPDNQITEHRIWQQYLYKHKIGRVNVSHRFRAEQRFIKKYGETSAFAQRARYFVRAMIPLKPDVAQFEKGPFVALQNEAFIHLQNADAAKVFDQNRAYVAAGYRIGKQLDLEAGYLNQTSTGSLRYTTNHVVQLAVYTRF